MRLILFFIILVSGCSLFGPGNVEEPLFLKVDPLSFSSILFDNTKISPVKFNDYNKLFADNMVFIDASQTTLYTKQQLIDRINTIIRYDSVSIEWSLGSDDGKDSTFVTTTDTVLLQPPRFYTLKLYDKKGNMIDSYSGKSVFKMLFNGNYWEIVYWKDQNTNTTLSEKSFFNPEF